MVTHVIWDDVERFKSDILYHFKIIRRLCYDRENERYFTCPQRKR